MAQALVYNLRLVDRPNLSFLPQIRVAVITPELPEDAGKGLLLAQDVAGIDLWENEVRKYRL
jgi:hypothetical protein